MCVFRALFGGIDSRHPNKEHLSTLQRHSLRWSLILLICPNCSPPHCRIPLSCPMTLNSSSASYFWNKIRCATSSHRLTSGSLLNNISAIISIQNSISSKLKTSRSMVKGRRVIHALLTYVIPCRTKKSKTFRRVSKTFLYKPN